MLRHCSSRSVLHCMHSLPISAYLRLSVFGHCMGRCIVASNSDAIDHLVSVASCPREIRESASGVNIKVVNRCAYPITAFARSGSSSTNSYKLAARGGSQNLNVGTSWPAGIVFATKDGSQNNARVRAKYVIRQAHDRHVSDANFHHQSVQSAQAGVWLHTCLLQCALLLLLQTTQLELTVGGSGGMDFYDISLVVSLSLFLLQVQLRHMLAILFTVQSSEVHIFDNGESQLLAIASNGHNT